MDSSLPLEAPSLSRRQLLNFLTGATIAATVALRQLHDSTCFVVIQHAQIVALRIQRIARALA